MDNKLKKKIRRQARGKLYALLKKQYGKCAYCGRVIVRLSSIREDKRIKVTQCKVTYISRNGKRRIDKIATIDHKIRIMDGGDNSDDNIVASCAQCNFERDRKNYISTKSWICICGNRKQSKKVKYCHSCWFLYYIRRFKNDYY